MAWCCGPPRCARRGRAEAARAPPNGALDGGGAEVDLPHDLPSRQAGEIVPVIERVVRDLVALARGPREGRAGRGAGEIGAHREERERVAARRRLVHEPRHREVVHEGLGGRRRREPVDGVVVRDFVEVDADGRELHGTQAYARGDLVRREATGLTGGTQRSTGSAD
jgi:hypothetical protein